MNTLLICPAERPSVAHLAESAPLVLVPLLGRSLIEYWLEALVARGVKHVTVLAADRPHQVRNLLEDGARWGVQVELIPQSREPGVEEARARHLAACAAAAAPSPAGGAALTQETTGAGSDGAPAATAEDLEVIVLDHLPGRPEFPLFESYAGWFAALAAFMPHAVTPARIGAREVEPGIWVGLHTQISPTARLNAPCWIGEHVLIGDGAVIGPDAILEDRVVVESGTWVAHSAIGPETFVGELMSVQHSLASGSTLVNWQSGSCLRVPDAFFLCSLGERRFAPGTSGLPGRTLACLAMIATAPAALAIMLLSLLRGESPLLLRLGVRSRRHVHTEIMDTFVYYELAGGRNWLRRWPQFWSVVRGDLTWVGNRPLRPSEALSLANNFERLWLTAPVGLLSLGDAYGCVDELSDETVAHASYYAVNPSRRLDWFILARTLFLAAASWPIRWTRRKERPVPLRQLVPKQEI
jgi:hypothetical protein